MRRKWRQGLVRLLLFTLLFMSVPVTLHASTGENPPIVLNSVLDSPTNQAIMAMAGLSGGNTGLVYAENDDPSDPHWSSYTIYYKVISPSGDVLFVTNLNQLGVRKDANEFRAIGIAGGKSVITWAGTSIGCGGTFQFLIFDATGTLAKGPTDISTAESFYNCYTNVKELPDGNIVFLWQDKGDEYLYRIFDGLGNALTNPESVEKGGSRQDNFAFNSTYHHSLSANDQGQFLITYDIYQNNNYIGAMYDNNGNRRITNGYHHFYLGPKPASGFSESIGLDGGRFGVMYKTSSGTEMKIIDNQGTVLQTISSGLNYTNGSYPLPLSIKTGGFLVVDSDETGTILYTKHYSSDGTVLKDWTNRGAILDLNLYYTFEFGKLIFAGYDAGFGYYNSYTNQLFLHDIGSSTVNAETPAITVQPADLSVNVGDSATLSVAASISDGGTLSYQWYSNTTRSSTGGTPITGATSATYDVPTTTAGTTYYYVVVTNTNNAVNGNKTATATSNAAEVVVHALVDAETPTITTQPADQSMNVGDSVTLRVTASTSDGGTLSYQWYSNTTRSSTGGTPIPGATSEIYDVPTTTAGTTYYYVVVTNTNNAVNGNKTATATSNAAEVVVHALVDAETPSITTQPADQSVNVGDSVTLSVTASTSDGGTLSYQWYSNTTPDTTSGTPITGATSATYAVPTTTAGTTYYYVVVTNTNNAVNGNKTASTTSSVAEVKVHYTYVSVPTPPTADDWVEVMVNGQVLLAGRLKQETDKR